LLALPAALFMRRYSFKAGILMGLVLFGTGTLLFWPAALVGRYGFFLGALFVMASGLSFLETAAGTFITLAGPAATAERRLNVSQAFNPLGSIAGALIGTKFILSGVELTASKTAELKAQGTYAAYLHAETLRVVAPYVALSVVAFVMVVLIARTRFPTLATDAEGEAEGNRVLAVLRNRHLLFAIVAQFFYVGAQVGTWSYFIRYVEEFTGQSEKAAGYFLTGTLVMFGVGRFTSAALMKRVSPARLMGVYCCINMVLVALAIVHPGVMGVWMIFVTSFFMSLMFPTIFALGLQGLGADSKVGGSLLIMAIVGGAVLTPVMGFIADRAGSVAFSYGVPLVGYVVIASYAFFGQRRDLV
jgi:FHS family L-fucose permease-like MFS transporter